MGGLSGGHILLIIIVILVFFGPSRLPGLGKSVGEAIRGFKKGLEGDEIDVTNNSRRENLQAPQQDTMTQSQAQSQAQPQGQTQGQAVKDKPRSES